VVQLTIVDAFTKEPFRGNPAAVAVLDAFPADEQMQLIAREMNHSETAFAVSRPDGDLDLRWFTPTGSAHCALAPYWAERLGRDDLTGYQASARGGTVRVRLDQGEVVLLGQAVTMASVELAA
jgi:PhzF family phenazine biosynthesis protein